MSGPISGRRRLQFFGTGGGGGGEDDMTLPISMADVTGLTAALAAKVGKIDGMGLSSNDFTDEYRQKLDSIDPNPEPPEPDAIWSTLEW